MATIGKVVLLTGNAILVNAQGVQHALHLGDSVNPGDTIIAPKGSIVELQLANDSRVQIASQQTVTFTQDVSNAILDNLADPNVNAVNQDTIQSLVQAINSGDSIDDIVQALAQQKVDANEGFIVENQRHTFVDLMRIDDVLNQFDYKYDVASREYKDNNPLEQDRDVTDGEALSSNVYLPRIDQDLNAFNFTYKTQREQFESRRNDQIREANDPDYNTLNNPTPVSNNLAPVATPSTASGNEDGGSIALSLTGTDTDGTIAFIRVVALPPSSQGVLLYDNDGNAGTPPIAVPINANLTPAQAASIVFVPAANFNGTVNIPFTVTDNGGATSPAATAAITVNPANDPPVATPTPASGNEDTNISVSLTGNDNLDASNGGTVTQVNVTVFPNALTEGQLYYQAGGAGPLIALTPATNLTPLEAANLTFVPVADYNGTVNLTYTVTDNSGTTSTPANTTITVNPVVDPLVDIYDITVNEGAGTATFTIKLNQATTSTVVVAYNTSNGTATAGSDYTNSLGNVTFAPGQTNKTITIPILDDSASPVYEGPETFNVNLSLVSVNKATIGDGLGIGTIVDDGTGTGGTNNDLPVLSVVAPSGVIEGISPYAIFTVNLSNPSVNPVVFTPSLSGSGVNPATIGTDTGAIGTLEYSTDGGTTWNPVAGNVTVPAGATSVQLRLPITDDLVAEGNETFTLTATPFSGANPAAASAVTTIIDNEGTPQFIINDITVNEGAGTATFTIKLTTAAAGITTVDYSTANGTATAGLDYTATSGTVTFAAGLTTQTITVPILNDNRYEIAETFNVNLTNPTGGALIADAQGVGTIRDDGTGTGGTDNDIPALTLTGPGVVNEAAGTITYTVTLSNVSDVPVNVNYGTADGTAVAGSDYTGSSGTLTFAAGQTVKTFTVPILNDATYEGSENFNINLTAPINATISASAGSITTTIKDDGTGATGTGPGGDNDTPSVSVSSPNVTEAAGYAVFTVSLSNPSSVASSFNLTLNNGTATGAGTDFGSAGPTNLEVSTDGGLTWNSTTTATIAANTNSVLVRTPIINDNISEPSENFTLTATTSAGITSNASATGTATITDNDGTPSLVLTGPGVVNEAAGTITYTVTLSNPSSSNVTVNYGTADAGASAGSDYTNSSGVLTFSPNQTVQTFTVPILNDATYEGSENFAVNLTVPTNATIATGSITTTIRDDGTGATGTGPGGDDDRPVVTAVGSPNTIEGGNLDFAITVTPSTTSTTVTLTPSSGTAILGTDTSSPLQVSFDNGLTFTNIIGTTVSVPAGVTDFIVRVPTVDDVISETNENITLAAATVQNAISIVGTGTITDNDTSNIVINDVTRNEADGTITFTIKLTKPSVSTVTVDYATVSGDATVGVGAGVDVVAGTSPLNGTLTFAPNMTTQTITLNINNDTIYEGSESFNINLSNATGGAAIGDAQGVGTIIDDEAVPTISIAAASATEGSPLNFVVTQSSLSSTDTTVTFTTSSGVGVNGALSGTDFTATTTTVTIPAGSTTATVAVASTQDTIYEGNETFTATLSTAVGATIGTATAIGTILNDDAVPTLSITSASQTEGISLVHTVTLSGPTAVNITYAYSLGGGTATGGGTDYTTPPTFSNGVTLSGAVLTVPAGVTSFTVTIPTFDDALNEANETYNLTIGGTTAVGTIIDNDPTPTLSINDVTVAENVAGGLATFTVTLSAASGQIVTVGYNTSNGTATAGSDYTSTTGTITFTPGQTTQTITVPITNDTLYEPNETFYVNLLTPTNATITDNLGVGTILDNDTVPTVSSISTASQLEGVALVHTVTLSNASATATTLAYSIGGGTATSGADYNATPTFSNGVTLSSGVLTVPAGVASFTVTVPSIQDAIFEPDETYNLTVGTATATGTITNDDAAPTLSVSSLTVAEATGNFAVFTIGLSNPSSTAVSVGLALANGTATGGGGTNDYGSATVGLNLQYSTDGGTTWINGTASTVATFAAGTTSILARTPIIVNAPINEPTETFTLTATTSAGTTANPNATGTASIVDRSLTSTNNPTVTEGTALAHNFTVAAFGSATTYSFSISGTATSGADYNATPTFTTTGGAGTVTLAGGILTVPGTVTGFSVTIATIDDTLYENAETAIVNIGGVISTGTINDNDAIPSFVVNDVTVNEGAGTATFTVKLSTASGLPATVDFNTTSATAVVGNDFTATSGTLTFAPGVTTQSITVNIVNDNIYEGTETFKVNLLNPTNATIADNQGIGTIKDDGTGTGGTDNDTPTFTVSNVTSSDQVGGFAIFTVSMDKASVFATTFSLALANGTATGSGTDYGSATATNIQVSTDNGTTWISGTTATIAINQTYVLVRTPITIDAIIEGSETYTLTATRTAGTTTNASAVGTGTITDVNNAPDAIDDTPTSNLQEDTVNSTLSGNAILGGSGNVTDTDPNNDTLSITGAVAGTGAVVGAVTLASPLTVSGTYGSLLINANGTYTYTLDNSRIQTQNMLGGQTYNDVFTYKITDGNGGFDTATISVAVLGTLDLTAIVPQPVAVNADGLSGEFYGYNDSAVAGNRVHADDQLATKVGTAANLDSVEDIEFIINGRNAIMGGGNIVGTNKAAVVNTADVVFNVRTLNYGLSPQVTGDLGGNQAQASGAALLPQDNVGGSTTRALGNFLDQDSSTAKVQTGTPTGATVGTQTGLGKTTDAIIRMSGNAYLERGNYDFRVIADDGFRLKVGGKTLLEFDGNQAPTVRVFKNVEVNDLISGLTSIELLYWEQGGNANLTFDYKLSSSSTYIPFSLDSLAFFSTANTPQLTDTRLQDIVETSVNQQYELRTGSALDGDGNTNTLTGQIGRDYIQGLGGDDVLYGYNPADLANITKDGADFLDGGTGNDQLFGGYGNDVLDGGTGADTMTGGMGDDIYRIDNVGDVINENANEGTDTIEIEATYNPGTYVIPVNFENVLVKGSFNVNVTGNAVDNRITGNDGNNVLIGNAGDDRIIGGKGNDTLSGDAGPFAGGNIGKDIFEWGLADKGTLGAPAIDTITDFNYANNAYGSSVVNGQTFQDASNIHGDSIDLRDLLVGEQSTEVVTNSTPQIGNLLKFIDFQVVGADTIMHISSNALVTGGFNGTNATGTNFVAGQEDQRIIFAGVNLYTATGATAGDETQLLQALLKNGTLVVD